MKAIRLDDMATEGNLATEWKKSQDGASGAPTCRAQMIEGTCEGDWKGVVGGVRGWQECGLSPEFGEEWVSLWDTFHIWHLCFL